MLRMAIIFLLIAIVAGIFGFVQVADISMQFAQVVFFIFVALFLLAAVVHTLQGRYPSS